ncbi:IPT/TIG domain-containing protein [Chloroflexota bacterium]
MMKVDCLVKRSRIQYMLVLIVPVILMLTISAPALAAPTVTLSPNTGSIGTRITIIGTNFESYRGDDIFIFFNDEEITNSPLTIPQTGNFSVEFNIPADAAPGRNEVEVRSETRSTSMLASTLFYVTETEIKLNVSKGTVGTSVTVNGTGFYAGRMVVLYYYNRIGEKLGTEIVNSTGEFEYRFNIPNSTAGTHKITVENTEGNSAEAELEVIPSVSLNLTSGASGDILAISGTGFGYRSDISVYFKTTEVAYAKTNEYGIFEVTFNVPEMKPATYDVKAEDEDKNTDRSRFTITAGASLDQTTGPVGAPLTVTGSGFESDKTVTISYDSLKVATANTDNDGDFSNTFNVPASTSGKHIVTVSDGITTRQLAFTVESEAPPTPTLLLPAFNSGTKSEAYFDWEDITDASQPITYSLQVASEQNFASIKLEKKGLTDSEYTMSEKERLAAVKKEAPYYWRVKAIDSATNESDWSTPWSFYVAAPPTPALLLPEMGSKAEALVYFVWEDVTSLSPPITYNFQVAADNNFTSIVLVKEELTDSEYTLTEGEKLAAVKKEAPYYWRVKAIDSAASESDWSTPGSFYIGFSFALPGWAVGLLIGLGVIFIGFLAFLAGRKTAYYQGQV